MIIIDDTLVSDELIEKHFVCDLTKCQGACCEEGDLGAPLDEEEIDIIDEILPLVKPYMTQEGLEVLDQDGFFEIDVDGDFVTTTVQGKACVFATKENNIWKCAIEKAYLDGKTNYIKPISCHLYPVRIEKQKVYTSVNYHKWSICSDACSFGKKLQIPVFQFLEKPLVRKFGESWYNQLKAISQQKK